MIRLRSFSWKGVLVFFGFVAALSAWTWSGVFFANHQHTPDDLIAYFLELFQRSLLNYFPAYVLVGLADGLSLRGAVRRIALGVSLVAGIALAVQVRCAVNMNEIFYAYDSVKLPYCTSFPTWRTYFDFPSSWITPLLTAAMVMIFIFTRRHDGDLVASLHRVHAEELDSRRQRVEAELNAMQSRVDPDRLLQTLRTVRARYETKLEEGEAMLDRLIDDLRAAARAPAAAAD
jgi:hypothetical protein